MINFLALINCHYSYTAHCILVLTNPRNRRGRDRMVVGFTTTYAISAYHH